MGETGSGIEFGLPKFACAWTLSNPFLLPIRVAKVLRALERLLAGPAEEAEALSDATPTGKPPEMLMELLERGACWEVAKEERRRFLTHMAMGQNPVPPLNIQSPPK